MYTAMKWVIFILSFGVVACSGKVTITDAEIQPDIFYARGAYKPFSGRCVVVFSKTGEIKDQFTYKNGLLNGEAITYDKNGQLRRKGYYLDGKLSGKWEFWDAKGNKIMEASYQNDVLYGSYKRFDNLK
jgi:hypothetical protein